MINGVRFGKSTTERIKAMVTDRRTTEYLRNLVSQKSEFERCEQYPLLPPESAELLKLLVILSKPKKILEIGTNIGSSGIVMLSAAPDAMLYTVEMDEDTANMARQNFDNAGVGDRVHVLRGKAEEILPYITDNYDFIFLDGPKGQYSFLCSYLLPMLNRGGLLVCDNVLFRGMVSGKRKVKARKRTLVKKLDIFLKSISSDPTLQTSVIPIGDGMSISYKK